MDHPTQGRGFFKTLCLVIVVVAVTAVATVQLTTAYLFPKSFKPVELNHKERQELEAKLRSLKFDLRTGPPAEQKAPAAVLEPQRYSEAGASREVSFSEREVNALIANNTDLSDKLAIDFSRDLVSASVLMPLDPEMPVFGGKTLKLAAGLELYYKNGKPVVVLEGVSLWGVPLPNSWLGNLKNIDLVHEFGDEGFWKAFADGVADISVGDGSLTLKLKE
ncbi:MAG: arginine N-succinyltransferase [Alphaproteobacteria bacterium]|nr:arginine N-succinyltransferase [Alphaproteobacteria bacterium]